MPDPNDVNNNPVVTDSGVVEAPPTEQTDVSQVTTDKGEQSKADGQQEAAAAPAVQTEEHDPVPYSRFKEVTDAKNAAQEENDQLRNHLNAVGGQNQNIDQNQLQTGQQPTQQEGVTLQVMKSMGIDPDLATPVEMAQVNDKVMSLMVQGIQQQNQNQNFIATHADFAQVVGQSDPKTGQFIYAPPLARVLQKEPQLLSALQGPGGNALAYRLAVNDPAYQAELAELAKTKDQVTGENVEKVINQAQGLASVSVAGTSGVIDKGAQMRAMTDEQITAHGDQIIQQGGVAM